MHAEDPTVSFYLGIAVGAAAALGFTASPLVGAIVAAVLVWGYHEERRP